MSSGECEHHHKSWRKKLFKPKKLYAAIVSLCMMCGMIVMILALLLRPKKPSFLLQDATVFAFAVSSTNLLNASFQVTLEAHNHNSRIEAYYEGFRVYAVYQNQQITFFTSIPPTYQGHKGDSVWSPFLYGFNVPIAPYNGAALAQIQSNGSISLAVKIDGQVRWKILSITWGPYHIHVTCPAVINFGNNSNNGVFVDTFVKYQLSQSCSVSV
ncbi:NDR1/HIN1-like protein 1 [Impatiens glandulifera]|uniref:NDR1/HIN1-like protein 1 n=1 Tax=Impatiens glandulifera TaxID=253017 RepID=UPI001FB055CD|nr:NDR1/HIN1-like protein 1 [Impatiens glandulifera]